jgi:hypothetical protein
LILFLPQQRYNLPKGAPSILIIRLGEGVKWKIPAGKSTVAISNNVEMLGQA